ncbi:hypothetical protein KJ951_02730 [Patescibacteria group bacterium]|nr:hypothetical protein [Patescibacteria group bacterium]MBU1703296.1 hypothetical protein [Patescibacteria group bacterium]MBU1954025.1 hypothetical protein [Patescibacteria group bacterium]
MPTSDPNTDKKLDKLTKEVSELKQDIHSLKSVLLKINAAGGVKDDRARLEEIEKELDGI